MEHGENKMMGIIERLYIYLLGLLLGHRLYLRYAANNPIIKINTYMVQVVGHVSGSRYMARLRATGADWGLDTRIIF